MQVNDSDGHYRELWNESHVAYSVINNDSFADLFNDTNVTTTHHSFGWKPEHFGLFHLLATSIVLGLMILCTIIGNVFVVAAIILERNLQSVANYLIMSLAVADLMVASLVMPISAVHEVTLHWFLGAEVCDIWVSFDVLCCTASILHLVAIALDRYFAVTQVDYIRQRTAQRVILMIVAVWGISITISIPPLFGWKDDNNPNETGLCVISQDWGYTIFSTMLAFYIPLFFMMIIYAKIFRAARSRIRKTKFGGRMAQPPRSVAVNSITAAENATVTQASSSSSDSPEQPTNGSALQVNDANKNNTHLKLDPPSVTEYSSCGNSIQQQQVLTASPSTNHMPFNSNTNTVQMKHIRTPNLSYFRKAKEKQKVKTPVVERPRDRTREKIEHRRERKAARTLAIVTGCFVTCWVPFFVIALVSPICGDACKFPEIVLSIVLWLGYLNSLLNPVIYTIFNPDFRNAFRKILFGKYRNRGRGGRGR